MRDLIAKERIEVGRRQSVAPGDRFTAPDDEAARLIRYGSAVAIDTAPVPTPVAASAAEAPVTGGDPVAPPIEPQTREELEVAAAGLGIEVRPEDDDVALRAKVEAATTPSMPTPVAASADAASESASTPKGKRR